MNGQKPVKKKPGVFTKHRKNSNNSRPVNRLRKTLDYALSDFNFRSPLMPISTIPQRPDSVAAVIVG
jgi:hypothetical protein